MLNSETPGRTLSSLTPEECQTLFALAFGYTPPLDKLYCHTNPGGATIGFPAKDQSHLLLLYTDGQALATNKDDQGRMFNFRKVAGYLDSLNIDFQRP